MLVLVGCGSDSNNNNGNNNNDNNVEVNENNNNNNDNNNNNNNNDRSEEHTSELQSRGQLVCRLLLAKKKKTRTIKTARRRVRPRKGSSDDAQPNTSHPHR